MTSKRCTKCHQVKPISNFSRQKNGLYGRRANCKTCQVKINQEHRHQNKINKQDKKCWRCGKKLSSARIKAEIKRMSREGFGAKLPRCENCI